jgi:LPXTG-motif cell wall-anchored protein
MMRKCSVLGACLGVTAICLSFSPARAATVFDLTGTFADNSTISGTVTIDTTFSPGSVDAVDLLYLGSHYTTIQSQGTFTGSTPSGFIPNQVGYLVDIGTSSSTFPSIHLLIPGIPNPVFLTDYPGGPLCSADFPCGPDRSGITYATAFHPDAADAVTLQTGELNMPIPATLPLFATGIGGLGLLGWRRKRKAQAA